ncbi:MAG: response regulator [Gammaproteobacteria bacterium]|nr:response regulator [Gammaproteobacteria bacterium]
MSIKKTILVVDDSPTNIAVIGDILSPYYQVKAANSGQRALKNILKPPVADLILLDVMMPEMDGYSVLKELQSNIETQAIPVIFVTAMNETNDEKQGLELGAVDYITKPVRPAILLARVQTHLTLKDALKKLQEKNTGLEVEVQDRTRERDLIRDVSMKALSSLAKTRDNETGNHILRTQAYIETLANYLFEHSSYASQLSKDKIETITKAAPLHDIGKVGIPDAILLKQGKLTADEFNIMKKHAQLGADALKECTKNMDQDEGSIGFLYTAIEISNYHHEKWDGKGYPEGLSGDNIPLSARLMSLADVFDALISRRCYKDPFSFDESVNIILDGDGTHFDPEIVNAFMHVKEKFLEISQTYSDDDFFTDDIM